MDDSPFMVGVEHTCTGTPSVFELKWIADRQNRFPPQPESITPTPTLAHVPSSPLRPFPLPQVAAAPAARRMAAKAFAAGDYSLALGLLEGIDGVPACVNRAACDLELGMARACIKECDAALQMDPASLRAHYLKGLAFRRLGRTQEARATWSKTLDLCGRPDAGDIWLYREVSHLIASLDDDGTSSEVTRSAQGG
jgi:tetratricopeptide (TPR) repeat protein